MSRTITLLNTIQRKKAGKYSLALDKELTPDSKKLTSEDREAITQVSKTNISWKIWLAISVIFLFLLGLNFKMFFITRNYAVEKNAIMAKLNNMEASLKTATQQVNAHTHQLSEEIKIIKTKIKDLNTTMKQFEEANDGQAVAVENLTKAKNTLFTKVSSLGAELEALKKTDEQLDNSQAR